MNYSQLVHFLSSTFTKEEFFNSLENYFEFKKIILKFWEYFILKTEDIFYKNNYCYSIKDNIFLLEDNIHQSALSSQMINDLIMKEIKKKQLNLTKYYSLHTLNISLNYIIFFYYNVIKLNKWEI